MAKGPSTSTNILQMKGQVQGGGKIAGATEGDFATLGNFYHLMDLQLQQELLL